MLLGSKGFTLPLHFTRRPSTLAQFGAFIRHHEHARLRAPGGQDISRAPLPYISSGLQGGFQA
eukprot:9984686-Alexandrium_andersonii.AAC.1